MNEAPDDAEGLEGGGSSDREPQRRVDVKLVIALSLSALFVLGLIGVALLKASGDGCGDWERQLDRLSNGLTRHRLAKGPARQQAVDELLRLELPCAKVSEARDACAEAYLSLLKAEGEQVKAKAGLTELEGRLAELDPDQISRLRAAIDRSIKAAERHVEAGTEQNERCDKLYKELVEEGQRR